MLKAELVILNGNVKTLNPEKSKAEALAVYDGKIVAVGSNSEVCKYIGDETKVVDVEGKLVIPGFNDCHVHMTGFGNFLRTLNLREVKSIKEMQDKIKEFARENPDKKWILGGRWDHEKFIEKRYPTRWDLDEALSEKPVFLVRVCGHLAVANTKALKLAGITKETVVEDGKIDLDEATGEPNGILREKALDLVWKVIPKPTFKELEEACIQACREAVKNGLTCVHWIVNSADEIRIIQKLYLEGKLPIRVYLGIPVKLLDTLVKLGLTTNFGNKMVKVGFVKIFSDGSLGARTAALKEPYKDKPETRGMLYYDEQTLEKLVLKAHKAGLQLGIHAIGDKAVEIVVNAYEKALENFSRENHRHRIEHCSVLNPNLIERIRKLGLIASIQPHFTVSDFWVEERVGKERARWVYPFKTLISKGITVISGSDCPVEPINPILGIWAAVTRANFSEERLTVEEALKTYTVNAAYAAFDEKERGTIKVGKFADLTVLSEDIFSIPKERIKEVSVEMTVVNGKIVYKS